VHGWSLQCSRSFKVTDFGTNRKPSLQLLSVDNINWHPISHNYSVIMQYHCFWWEEGYHSLTQLFGVNPSMQDHEIWPTATRNITLSYNVNILTDDYFTLSQCTRQTDGRREFPSLNRVLRTCSGMVQILIIIINYWSCISSGWKPPLKQSAARHHLSCNADCFPAPPQNLSLYPIISFLTVFGS